MTSGDSLTITIAGRDVGLEAVLKKVDAEMQKSADQAVKLGQSYARLAAAQGKPVASSQILAQTIAQSGAASEKALIGIETQAARLASSGGGIAQFGASAASSLTSFLGPAALATAAIGGLIAVGKSFGEAFAFKAELDATTLAVNAQIKGIRESGQVWSQAASFANEYKLTTEETTKAVQASIGVMRSSKASVEDILGVLARMQVLSPEQSLEEAAIALKSLAAGDTTSLVTRFEVSRDVANQMKEEILGGADAVAVMSKFLGDSGVGMDVLAAKTQGAAGAIKDLAIANEQLALAQAKFAQGPGLAILETQTRAVSTATRLLTGDTDAMGQSLRATLAQWDAQAVAQQNGATAAQQAAAGMAAYNAAIGVTAQLVAQSTAVMDEDRIAIGALQIATDSAATAFSASSTALAEETQKKLDSAQAAQQLAAFQETLASLGGAVAGGLQTAGAAAAQLASQYNIATDAALQLINAQAALAQAKVNAAALVEQRAGERGPGGSGVQEAANQEQARLNAIYKKLVIPEPKARKARKGGGGGVKLSDQQKLQNSLLSSQEQYEQKSEDAATQHAIAVEKINQDFYEKMAAAQKDFDLNQLEGRASFYDTMGGIESQAIQQQASAAYEAASIEAGKIAAEKGADVAEKYMDAQEQIISSRAKRLSDIEAASNKKDKKTYDPARAEYLKGVDAEYKKAEDAKLARIQEGKGSIEAEHQKQLDDAAAKEADAQDKIGLSAERASERQITAADRAGKKIDENILKAGALAATYDRIAPSGAATGSALTTPPVGAPPAGPGATVAAAAPVDPIVAALDAIRAAVDAAANAIVGAEKDTGSAVRNLSGRFAS